MVLAPEKPASQPQAGAAPKTEEGAERGRQVRGAAGSRSGRAQSGRCGRQAGGGPADSAKPAGSTPTAPDAPKGASPKP